MGWRDTIQPTTPDADPSPPATDPAAAAPVAKSWRDTIKSADAPAAPASDQPHSIHDEIDASHGKLPSTLAEAGDYMDAIRQGVPGYGLAQKAGAAVDAGLDQLRGSKNTFGKDYANWRDNQNVQDIARNKRDPALNQEGNALGAAMTPQGPTPLSRIIGNTAIGAADAATRQDSLPDAKSAAAKAAALSFLTSGASELGQGVAGGLQKFADNRTIKSLGPTLNQQEVLNRKQDAGDLAQELRDNGVVKFGSSVEEMAPRISELLRSKGQRIGDIRDAADANGAQVDMSRLASKGDAKVGFSNATNQPAQAAAQSYADNASNLAQVPKRTLGQAQEEIQSLNDHIPFDKDPANLTPQQQSLKELRGDVVGQVDDQVRQKVPESADEYGKLKGQFGMFKDADKVLDKSVARSARNNDLGLSDLLAGGAAAKSGGIEGGLKAGLVAGVSKLAHERGNSAAAITADKLSGIISNAPEAVLGRYGDALRNAATRGNAALMATHALLMRDPDYVKRIKDADQGDQ